MGDAVADDGGESDEVTSGGQAAHSSRAVLVHMEFEAAGTSWRNGFRHGDSQARSVDLGSLGLAAAGASLAGVASLSHMVDRDDCRAGVRNGAQDAVVEAGDIGGGVRVTASEVQGTVHPVKDHQLCARGDAVRVLPCGWVVWATDADAGEVSVCQPHRPESADDRWQGVFKVEVDGEPAIGDDLS